MKFKLATAAAAVLMSATASQAADLAKKAPVAVDYVKVCDAYGAGFFYIPGSETCLKIGGYMRFQVGAGDGDFGSFYNSTSRAENNYATRARFLLKADVRSNTEFGLLRGYTETFWTVDSGSNGSASTGVDHAYLQFAGLTAGRTQSFFDFWTGYTLNTHGFSELAPDAKTNLLAYTFGFGNGVSATLSLEDSTTSGRRTALYSGSTGDTYGGNKMPDLVANVRLDQAWGSAQIAGALHQAYSYYATPDKVDELGWAVSGGIEFKLPMLGAGDKLAINAAYAKGAVGYVTSGNLGSMPFDTWDFDTTFGDKLSSAWSVAGGYVHVFSPTVSAALQASYMSFNNPYSNNDYDAKLFGVGASVDWTPVNNLTFRLGVEYASIDDGFSYVNGSTDNMDNFSVGLRIQRSF